MVVQTFLRHCSVRLKDTSPLKRHWPFLTTMRSYVGYVTVVMVTLCLWMNELQWAVGHNRIRQMCSQFNPLWRWIWSLHAFVRAPYAMSTTIAYNSGYAHLTTSTVNCANFISRCRSNISHFYRLVLVHLCHILRFVSNSFPFIIIINHPSQTNLPSLTVGKTGDVSRWTEEASLQSTLQSDQYVLCILVDLCPNWKGHPWSKVWSTGMAILD